MIVLFLWVKGDEETHPGGTEPQKETGTRSSTQRVTSPRLPAQETRQVQNTCQVFEGLSHSGVGVCGGSFTCTVKLSNFLVNFVMLLTLFEQYSL